MTADEIRAHNNGLIIGLSLGGVRVVKTVGAGLPAFNSGVTLDFTFAEFSVAGSAPVFSSGISLDFGFTDDVVLLEEAV